MGMTVREKEKNEPEIDYSLLAYCDVDTVFEKNFDFYEEELKTLISKDDVIKFAEEEFKKEDWLKPYPCCGEGIPSDFKEKFLKEVEKEFFDRMVSEWKAIKIPKGQMQ